MASLAQLHAEARRRAASRLGQLRAQQVAGPAMQALGLEQAPQIRVSPRAVQSAGGGYVPSPDERATLEHMGVTWPTPGAQAGPPTGPGGSLAEARARFTKRREQAQQQRMLRELQGAAVTPGVISKPGPGLIPFGDLSPDWREALSPGEGQLPPVGIAWSKLSPWAQRQLMLRSRQTPAVAAEGEGAQ